MNHRSSVLKIFTKSPLNDGAMQSPGLRHNEEKEKSALERFNQGSNVEGRPRQISNAPPPRNQSKPNVNIAAIVAPWFEDEVSTAPRSGMLSTRRKSSAHPETVKRDLDEEVAPFFMEAASEDELPEVAQVYTSGKRFSKFDAVACISTDSGSLLAGSSMNDAPNTNFVKHYKNERIYLAALIFNDKKELLINKKGFLPSIALYGEDDESGEIFYNFTAQSEHFLWAKQTSTDWEPTVPDVISPSNPFSFTRHSLNERLADIEEPSSITTRFRKNYYQAVTSMQETFGLQNFGIMEASPIKIEADGCVLILNVISVKQDSVNSDGIRNSGCSWGTYKKLNSTTYTTDKQHIWAKSDRWLSRSLQCLREGLYLGLFNCLVTVKGPMVLVQKDYPTLPPLKKIREKARLDQLESEILEKAIHDEKAASKNEFTKNLIDCFSCFNSATSTPLLLSHLISITPTQLDNDVQLLILSQVTPLGMKLPPYDTDLYELIPLQLFEMIHFSRYDSKVFQSHFRKMRILKSNKQDNKAAGNVILNEMKEVSKKYNDVKWTRVAIALSSMKVEGEKNEKVDKKVIGESAEQKRMKEIAPF